MKKRNDLQSAEQIPKILKLLIYIISLVSSKTTTALLGYIFSRPLRHKPHVREKEFIISSKKETHYIPSINKKKGGKTAKSLQELKGDKIKILPILPEKIKTLEDAKNKKILQPAFSKKD